MKISILNSYLFCFLYLVLSLTTITQAQTIAPQVLPFDKICAGNFNEYNAAFNYSGFPAGTTFQVILSDSSGSFTNPVNTTTLTTTNISASQQDIQFAVPTNLIGSDNYKLRVKSSTGFISGNFLIKDPINIGGTLNYFPAYYKAYEGVYFINNKKTSATICTGGNVILSIDNPTPNIQSSSPANYPNIKYKWFKGNTAISGQTGSSIVVNAVGSYYVIIDNGSCTDTNFQSNTVTVSQSAGGGSGFVSSSLGNPFCPAGGATTLSSITGNTYQWYRDNVKINNATNPTYSTNEEGFYSVRIDFGGCASTYNIDLKAYKTLSTINISNPSVLREGDTETVMVTTNAVSPSYEWYKDDALISGNNTNTYEVTSEGNYLVKVTQNSGCAIVNEIPFVVNQKPSLNNDEIPNLITPNGDGANDLWEIPKEYINNNTEVIIMNSNGEVVFKTNNYSNSWPESSIDFKSVNPVYYYIMTAQNGEVKKGSITIVN